MRSDWDSDAAPLGELIRQFANPVALRRQYSAGRRQRGTWDPIAMLDEESLAPALYYFLPVAKKRNPVKPGRCWARLPKPHLQEPDRACTLVGLSHFPRATAFRSYCRATC